MENLDVFAAEVPLKAQTNRDYFALDNSLDNSMMKMLPESYKDAEEQNILVVASEIVDLMTGEVQSLTSMSKEEILANEHKADTLFKDNGGFYNISTSELLKGFFQFKGTKADLSYLMMMV